MSELSDLRPERFPDRHQLHKYWGKKPANVVARLIERYTRRGQVVLDPFAGSGVTIVEAARLGRRAIGVELNPIAARLGALLLDPPPAEEVSKAGRAIIRSLGPRARELYRGRCAACRADVELRAYVWSAGTLVRVRGDCSRCGAKIDRPAEKRDVEATKVDVLAPYPDSELPRAWEMRKLVRAGVKRMSELFTRRNLALLAELRAAIAGARCRRRVREALWLTFTANLAQCSRMIADYRGKAGGPSWKINCYWLPKLSQELNVLTYFENRLEKTARALADCENTGGRGQIIRGDARNIPLEDRSIDYVFADPPYGGEGIQYGELSYLWNLWLGEKTELEKEIAFNPHRNKSFEEFGRDLGLAFGECRRVLAAGGAMTVAFNNREARVWELLKQACEGAGFVLDRELSIARSSPALTETVAARAPKSDVLLFFKLSSRRRSRPSSPSPRRRYSSSPSSPSAPR